MVCQEKILDTRSPPLYNAQVAITGGFFLAGRDLLDQRIRDGLLFDAYGAMLTEKQRMACDLVLMNDLSLAEAAERLEVSRQGVHDLVTRSREHMEELESSLGLMKKTAILEEITELLEEYEDALPAGFREKMSELMKRDANDDK